MRPFTTILIALFSSAQIFAGAFDELKLHSLYLMQQHHFEAALAKYREYSDMTGKNDFELLQQMGLVFLEEGIKSSDDQTVMMTIFGAGLSGSVNALDILEKGLFHVDPQVQLLALHFISKFDDDRALEIFNRAMSSDFLAIRMEAALYLAQRKYPTAVGQIEGLMYRLPPVFKAYFPPLFAILGTRDATQTLKRLIEDPDPQTRIESILNVARMGRDDFLPTLRRRLTHTHIAELEASIYAVGTLSDIHSMTRLKKLASSPTDSIRLAASIALVHLGDKSYVAEIENLAKQANLFAITALGSIEGSEEVLRSFLTSKDLQVKTNAAAALLQRHDPACIDALKEILIEDGRGLAFQPFRSIGRSLSSIKAIPSAHLRSEDPALDLSFSSIIKDALLKEAFHLPEKDFIALCRSIFEKGQNELIPTTVSLLENMQTTSAIELLKKGSRSKSRPLLRDYCCLSLYKMGEEGPFEERIKKFIMNQKQEELIQLKQILPIQYRLEDSQFTLTTEETSRLLIESFVAIASKRDEQSISFLLEAIQKGNIHNRYALMGLLMKSTE